MVSWLAAVDLMMGNSEFLLKNKNMCCGLSYWEQLFAELEVARRGKNMPFCENVNGNYPRICY